MITMSECTRKNTCYDCDNEACWFHGSKGADCPKYYCDKWYDCDHCEFIDDFIEEERKNIPMKLTKREQEVIHLRYVENKSLKEIADIYGVTKERIRQVEAKALWKTHKNNPEHSCDDCYHYWGTVPTCHNYPHRSKPCDDWRPKKEPKNATDAEKYDAYQEVWN